MKTYEKLRRYRKSIYVSIPLALIGAGAAIGAGAGTEGLSLFFAIVIFFGAHIYALIAAFLLAVIEELEMELAIYRHKPYFEKRGTGQNK